MSNENDGLKETSNEFDFVLQKEPIANAAPVTPKLKVKPVIAIEDIPEDQRKQSYTVEDLERLTKEALAAHAQLTGGYTGTAKKKDVVLDWSKMTQEDVFNMDIPIEAQGFLSGDILKVNLKDSNYEARWVSTNSQRLGYMKSIGFSYVTAEDLEENLENEVYKDAQDHFTINDVVLMRIQKQKYYPALRAAHVRSENTMKSTRAMSVANNFMVKTGGAEYAEAANQQQLTFYNAGGKV